MHLFVTITQLLHAVVTVEMISFLCEFQGGLDEIDEEALLAEEDDESDDTRSWRR